LIYLPEAKNDLEKLKSDLEKLERFIPQSEPSKEQALTPTQHAYQNHKDSVDSKREKLVETINNLEKQSIIKKIDASVQKINASLEGQGVKLIEDESTSKSLSR